MKATQSEFFVGYQHSAPPTLGRFLIRWVVGLLVVAIGLAVALVMAQRPFDPGVFEYGVVRDFEGILREHPVPALEVARPEGAESVSSYLLVAPGKHGAEEWVAGRNGERVRLRGTLIYRPGMAMIELLPDSLESRSDARRDNGAPQAISDVTLSGEIVDSKCYLGVMKPGRRKSHRACAVRCLSGGIPPILVVEIATGGQEQILLVDRAGGPLGPSILDYVAEPVRLSGRLSQQGEHWILATDPSDIERILPVAKEGS
ncbi:MAG: hypothetical protein K8J08_23000 [Thermoanaerobaculia bacterium]|nr:hypothetical protein [Thermoanaerobaculia bacterium]